MDSLTHLALITKAQLVFNVPGTFLSFPVLSSFSYPIDYWSFASSTTLTAEQQRNWAEFCQVANSLPTGTIFQPPPDSYLWDKYQEVLKTSICAAGELTAEQQADLAGAQSYLRITTSEGSQTDSPAVLAYKQCRDAWFKAVQDYNTQKLTADAATDSKQKAQWTNTDEPALRVRVAATEANWENNGNKTAVERAQQVEETVGAYSPQLIWDDWKSQLIPDIDLPTDPTMGQFGRTELVPSDAIEEKDWLSSTLTASEIDGLVHQAPKELAAIYGELPKSSEIESISFEYRSVGLKRNWLRPEMFNKCFWKFPEASRRLSDGGDPPQGEWPAYIVAVVLARNFLLKTRPSSVTPPVAAHVAPPPVFWGAGGDGMIMTMPVTPSPPPPAPKPPPQPEPQVSTEVSILCFICKRLPKCPNPDPELKW